MAKPIDLEGLTCKQWRIKKVICLESFFRIPLWGCSLIIVVFFVASCLLLSFAKYLKVHLSLFGLRVYGCSKMSFSLFLPLSGLGQFGKSIVNTHLIQNRARQYFCKNYHACASVNVNCIKRTSETPWRIPLTCYCRCLLSVWRQLSKQIPSALPIQIQILSKKERTCKFRLSI